MAKAGAIGIREQVGTVVDVGESLALGEVGRP